MFLELDVYRSVRRIVLNNVIFERLMLEFANYVRYRVVWGSFRDREVRVYV